MFYFFKIKTVKSPNFSIAKLSKKTPKNSLNSAVNQKIPKLCGKNKLKTHYKHQPHLSNVEVCPSR